MVGRRFCRLVFLWTTETRQISSNRTRTKFCCGTDVCALLCLPSSSMFYWTRIVACATFLSCIKVERPWVSIMDVRMSTWKFRLSTSFIWECGHVSWYPHILHACGHVCWYTCIWHSGCEGDLCTLQVQNYQLLVLQQKESKLISKRTARLQNGHLQVQNHLHMPIMSQTVTVTVSWLSAQSVHARLSPGIRPPPHSSHSGHGKLQRRFSLLSLS